MGTQMEMVVMGWFVLTLTDSPFLVGAISAARMSLNILALLVPSLTGSPNNGSLPPWNS